jgi:hypothetical protein
MNHDGVTTFATRAHRNALSSSRPATARSAGAFSLLLAMAAASPAAAQNFFIEFNRLQCVEETDWDGGTASDEPYVIFAVVRVSGISSSVIVSKSSVFSGVDTGETRGEVRTLWGFDGTAQPINLGQLIVLAEVMENDGSSAAEVRTTVQAGMTANLFAYVAAGLTFAQIRANLARDLHNLCGTAAMASAPGNPDDRIASAREMVWTADDLATAAGGTPVERELRFRDSGQDATYDLRFKLRVP